MRNKLLYRMRKRIQVLNLQVLTVLNHQILLLQMRKTLDRKRKKLNDGKFTC